MTVDAPLVAVRGVTKAYGANTVLRGIDVSIRPGEILALVGENGSGKSTLARIIAGITRPDGGQVITSRGALPPGAPRVAREHGVQYVAQEPALVPTMSVLDNMALGQFRWVSRGTASAGFRRAAAEALEQVGLETSLERLAGSLTIAEQTLLELGRVVLDSPDVVILDEVTTRLSEHRALLAVLKQQAERNVSTVLITHRFSEIRELADRAVVLRDGHLVGELPRAQITDEALTRLMVGRDIATEGARRTGAHGAALVSVRDVLVEGATEPVTLRVHAGEIVGIGGMMGSGRTELLETIAGARAAVSGQVDVLGKEQGRSGIRGLRRRGVGFVPEDRTKQGLVASASIMENVRLGAYRPMALVRDRKDRAVAQRMREDLNIRCQGVEATVASLSGGNAQKVVFARELATGPRVLLLDEPTRGVDVAARADIYEILRERAAAGCAVLLVSSDLPELVTLCDRVLVLYEGRLAGELTGDAISEEAIVMLSSGGELRDAVPVPRPTPSQ